MDEYLRGFRAHKHWTGFKWRDDMRGPSSDTDPQTLKLISLATQNQALYDQIEKLKQRIAELEAEVADLKEELAFVGKGDIPE